MTLAVLLIACGVLYGGLRVARADTSLPGITVADVEVGDRSPEEVAAALEDLATRRGEREVVTTRDEAEITSTASELGYELDVDATTEAVMARGRQGNPLLAFRDQVRATFRPASVAPVQSLHGDEFEAWVRRIADELALPPIQGNILLVGTQVQVVEPEPGLTIDAAALQAETLAALDGTGAIRIEVPTVTTTPETSPEQLEELAGLAERAVSAPVTLIRGSVQLTFTPEQIAGLLRVRVPAVSEAGGDGAMMGLELVIDPDQLLATIPAEQFAALAAEPQDARIEVAGGQVRVIPAVDGFRVNAPVAAAQLLQMATTPGPRTAPLEGGRLEPEFTTTDAEALGITEEVGSFTTQHPCCQSRVTNIHRMADLVRGAIIEPGETFSLNAHVGERTEDKGFVGGGAISGGEFVEQIGGGVSQFTTTMFNAIFFAGYDIVEFKPHSYYISRYPEGREATLNYSPAVDLKFTNDSPHGVYVDATYSDTAITVTLYGTEYAEVETTTGERYGFREPQEQVRETDELELGEERVVQSGRQGFSVNFTRTLAYVDGRTATEEYTTTYLPEPRIIEHGTGRPEPTPTPTPSEDAGEPSAQPEPTADPPPEPTAEPSPPPPAPAPTSADDGDATRAARR